ncbi:acylphosphatase [Marinobacter arenosus]|uniref:acylphosphatase n=1 Tax=Marinobacter arenosus TaxID=2856822 RepID=UPI001C4C0853|nr:acylphosphatase [Marinobacter arenosus]MBW0146086.1 acylphosphatase [Marinobacter arenosus]
MTSKRWTLLVSGLVQGVYYRASATTRATELGLTGYARNLSDGRVEIVAEGTQVQLERLKAWCCDGPPAARVDDIDVEEAAATGEYPDFGIRH